MQPLFLSRIKYDRKLAKKERVEFRDLIFLVLFIFPIPRINNTENNTIQEYSILTKKFLIFLNFIAFLAISDNSKHFLKIPIFGPKNGAHYGILG